ncbi:P-II family nitrogen regulator [Streptococcus agalactiae]|nr:P-II family nitrogen regulator [Streptococcus agalactiae]MBY5054411.1 P-II family nitrogen regulator [Streptococcus agalactiae]
MIVSDSRVDTVVEAIFSAVQTGEIGDSKIFIIPIEDAIRIRTGQNRDEAL